jgi:diguanylate cyclase (GGDEF)-like protein/PAS domain S-box-containing protein
MSALPLIRLGALQAWLTTAVIALAMLLMVQNQRVASSAYADALILQDQIGQIRQGTLRAQLYAERVSSGDPAAGPHLIRLSVQRAFQASSAIDRGRGTVGGLQRASPVDPDTRAAARRLAERLLELDRQLGLRAPGAPIPPEARSAQRSVDAELAALETRSLSALAASRDQLYALRLGFIALLTGSGLLLLWWMRTALARTERTGRQLGRQAAELEAFAGAVPDMSFLIDREGRYLRANASRPDLLQASVDDMVGRRVDELFPPQQAGLFMRLIERALQDGRASAEYRLHLPDGEHVFEARVTAVEGTSSVVWVSWDVTERVRQGERVEQLGRLYGLLSATNQAMVFSRDEAGLLQRVMQAAVDSGGYAAAWIAAPTGLSAPGPYRDVEDAPLERLRQALLQDPTSPLAEMLESPPQALRVFSRRVGTHPGLEWSDAAEAAGLRGLSLVCLGDSGGERRVLVLHALAAFDLERDHQALLAEIARDLDFARGQLLQREQSAALNQRLRQQALALRNSRDGVLLLDHEGRVLGANPAACELTGFEESELVGKPAWLLEDLRQDPAYSSEMRAALQAEGHWQGEVLGRQKSGRLHTLLLSVSQVADEEQQDGASQVLVFTDLTRQRESEARLRRIAHFDALTGLPNRDLLQIRLRTALLRARQPGAASGALIMLDLDNFRTFNETAGWTRGDEVLKLVALRLSEAVRPGDTLARLGGDEFVVVLENLREDGDAERIAGFLQATLRGALQLGDGERVYTQASLGLIGFDDCEGEAEDLLRNVEVALFEAKLGGRNVWRRFRPEMGTQTQQRLEIENRLREALQRQQFRLVYQPLVDLHSGRLVGLEALVRLDQPERTPIGPDVFIPILEQIGQIAALGDWVTHEACLQGRRWLDRGWDYGYIAINLSPAEVGRYPIGERVRHALENSGLPPERLELEITETGLMEQGEHAEAFLRELHALGVGLAIDDFGTGYSSLASLKRFPVHKLKIDRSFITELEQGSSDAFLVEAIIGVGQKLRIQVLAEGVENEGQRQFLRERGCRLAQGYLFSKPLPPDALFERYGAGGELH